MKVYTYYEERKRLADVLNSARNEEVIIKRKNGETFAVKSRQRTSSPFNVPGIKTKATTEDIIEAVRTSRERGY